MYNTYSSLANLQLWYEKESKTYKHIDLMNQYRGHYVTTPRFTGNAGDTAKFELWYKTYYAYTKIMDINVVFE